MNLYLMINKKKVLIKISWDIVSSFSLINLFLWTKTHFTCLLLVGIPQVLVLSGNCPCLENAILPKSHTSWVSHHSTKCSNESIRASPLAQLDNSQGPSQLHSLHCNSLSANSVPSPNKLLNAHLPESASQGIQFAIFTSKLAIFIYTHTYAHTQFILVP